MSVDSREPAKQDRAEREPVSKSRNRSESRGFVLAGPWEGRLGLDSVIQVSVRGRSKKRDWQSRSLGPRREGVYTGTTLGSLQKCLLELFLPEDKRRHFKQCFAWEALSCESGRNQFIPPKEVNQDSGTECTLWFLFIVITQTCWPLRFPRGQSLGIEGPWAAGP